jgi:putative redox protein
LAQTSIHVRTVDGASAAIGWSGPRTVTIDRSESAGGLGIGFNGGELLLLAIGACYTNDLFREAAKKNMTLKSVRVDVDGDWGGEPVRAQNVVFSVRAEAKATENEIRDLIEHTDKVAEIHNSLRMATKVSLGRTEAIAV